MTWSNFLPPTPGDEEATVFDITPKSHKWTLKTLWELTYRPNLSTAKRAADFRPVAETRFAKVHFGKWWKPRGLTGASVSRYDQVLDQSFGCHGVYGCVPFLPALQGFLVHNHAEWAEVNDECEVVVREEVDPAPQLLKLKKHPTKISNLNSLVGFCPCEKKKQEHRRWFMIENPIKMDDLGVPLFSETSICINALELPSLVLFASHACPNFWKCDAHQNGSNRTHLPCHSCPCWNGCMADGTIVDALCCPSWMVHP